MTNEEKIRLIVLRDKLSSARKDTLKSLNAINKQIFEIDKLLSK